MDKPRQRPRRWPYILERDFQDMVLEVAHGCGWLTYHTYDSRRSQAGFPDLTMVRGNRLIFVELKSYKGKANEAQEMWLAALADVPHAEVYLWRPGEQWESIVDILQRPEVISASVSSISETHQSG